MAVSAGWASPVLKDCCIPAIKWLIFDRLRDVSRLFSQVVLRFIDVTLFIFIGVGGNGGRGGVFCG